VFSFIQNQTEETEHQDIFNDLQPNKDFAYPLIEKRQAWKFM
jgi:hypothetical protein